MMKNVIFQKMMVWAMLHMALRNRSEEVAKQHQNKFLACCLGHLRGNVENKKSYGNIWEEADCRQSSFFFFSCQSSNS